MTTTETTSRIEFHDTYDTENAADVDVVFFVPELGKNVTFRMSRRNIIGLAHEVMLFGSENEDHIAQEMEALL